MRGVTVCVIVIVIIVSVLLISQVNTADAISRADFEALKSHGKELELLIIQSDEKLVEQRKLINDTNDKLEDLKKELKSISGTTWAVIQKKIDLESTINSMAKTLAEQRNNLNDVLRQKSDYIKELKSLGIEQQHIDKTDLSHLAKKIGIVNSNVCINMIKNNINSTCWSYKKLILLDSSNTEMLGKFTTDDDGYFHRGKPPIQNNCRMYDFDSEIRIFVDPSAHCMTRIKIIEIHPNFDTFLDHGNLAQQKEFEYVDYAVNKTAGGVTETKTIQVLNQTQDYGRILYHDRYIDKSCSHAIINADKMEELLPDTIYLMRNNCDERYTNFVTKEIIPIEKTYQDITTSQKYKDDARLEYIKEFCIYKYRVC